MQRGHFRRFRFWYAALVALVAILVAGALAAGAWLTPLARRKVVDLLERHYKADVEIRSLHLSLFPSPRAVVEGLVFRKKGQPDVPPLVTLRRAEANAGWGGLLRSPRRLGTVRLTGLVIHVARGRRKDHHPKRPPQDRGAGAESPFLIARIVADGTLLRILPKNRGKQPLEFDIYTLTLDSVGLDRPMRYRAQLRNAKPPGLIHAEGDFGPWDADDAGLTRLNGKYRFANADLGVFRGIAGTLSSTGEFQGRLERIEVNGQTDTPAFTVKAGNHPVHLKTTFHSIVDGTDGDTVLDPVTARFGKTTVVARGSVSGKPGEHGKTVSLDATVEDGDLGDILRLGVKSDPPPMTGAIRFRSKIVIPPGDRDIAGKLQLNGTFDIDSGKFSSAGIERKVSSLSERARGDTESRGSTGVASEIAGRFVMKEGAITLAGLGFHVPGAAIRLDGTYGLESEELDLRGTATMQARLSEMTTGIKSFMLKALDPFFHKDKVGTVIPIRITGTRKSPSIKLNLKP